MFTKFFQKSDKSPQNVPQGSVTLTDLNPRVTIHYGIPSTASILAFDPIQRLLAIGTLDGRIKVIGGDNIEGLLISPKSLPFKNLQFLQNQGFLASVSNENEIQVWDLENRRICSNLQWESNITAFSAIFGTHYMYVGDEYGFLSVLKYDADEEKFLHLPYSTDATGISLPNHLSIVGVLPQPCSSGNRVLIAYENGLIVLWDVTEDRAVLVRGHKDHQLKNEIVVHPPNDLSRENFIDTSDDEQAEKEISSLCWVSSDGTILAVGYVDGDILLWDLSSSASAKDKQDQKSANNVVKLQLSSGNRRLPVIVLHWSMDTARNDFGGQLFVYGGDEIGSEEVLTILNLDWSSSIEDLKCNRRVDLTLAGSFADMILVPNTGVIESDGTTSLFVLNNPGQLHFYDDACLSALISQPHRQHSVPGIQYPMVVPTVEPDITIAKLISVYPNRRFSKGLLDQTASKGKHQSENTMWPLTGGVPSQMSSEENVIERVYIAGYQDGSVRIWDATFPVLSPMFVLGWEVEGIEIAGASASVSALDFCSSTLSLAIGNEYGLVCLYSLIGNSDDTNFHFVTERKHEVHTMHYENGAQFTAVFSLLNSPVHTLQYLNSGVKLVAGFECGQVAVLDMSSLSVLLLTDCVSSSSTPAISLAVKTFPDTPNDSEDHSESRTSNESARAVVFILTRDGNIVAMDNATGNMISSISTHQKESTAISIFMLEGNSSISEASCEKHSLISSHDHEAKLEPTQTNSHHESDSCQIEVDPSTQASNLGQAFVDSLVLLCCEDALHLYSLQSVLQGDNNSIRKVNLAKPCCCATVFTKDETARGLILVYQTGVIEIRSLPDLDVVGESSLMSILRWNFKTNMHKTMSSSNTGQITLVNGYECAFISLLAFENDLRIPEALPCLHDKVLEAAADATSSSQNQKRKEVAVPGIFDGIIKGFQGGKADHFRDLTEDRQTVIAHLESIFSRFPFSDPPSSIADDPEVLELNIDDLDIDEPVLISSSSHSIKNDTIDKEAEREKLFEGGTTASKPMLRTAEEIRAKYRKAGDASSVAAHARDRLMERQEKLEKISQRTEELQSGAENFASMATELAKQMEKRKWWNI